MNKKQVIVALGLAAMLLIAGCSEQQSNSGDDLSKDSGVNVSGSNVGESYNYEVKVTEKNQYGLVQAQPPFIMDRSLERANLIRRYKYLNDQNNVHHVYLLSETGQVISYFTAQGKVSSVNSKLTNDQQIVATDECINRDGHEGGDDETNCYKTVESPQMDGSYGTNGNAIFFFTTNGQYVQWNGIYLVSEEPKNIQSSVILTEEQSNNGSNPNGTSNSTNESS